MKKMGKFGERGEINGYKKKDPRRMLILASGIKLEQLKDF